MPSASALLMRHSEAVFLANYLRLLIEWDARASVRIQQRGAVVGISGAPPTGCISFIALPLLAAPAPDEALADQTVSAGRLRDVLGDVSHGSDDRSVTIPDPVTGPAELAMLPPTSGWQPTGSGVADDVTSVVADAVTEFHRRVPPNADPDQSQRIAEEIWSRPGWSEVPIRALHTARNLGFLARPDAPIQGARAPGWSRISSPAGQVFSQDAVGSLSLRLMSPS